VRQKIVSILIGEKCLQLGGYRSLTRLLQGKAPGPEGSTSKLFWSQVDQELAEAATEMLGLSSQVTHGSEWAPDEGQWAFYCLLARASGIRAYFQGSWSPGRLTAMAAMRPGPTPPRRWAS
jgi:hypothetical protein